VQYNDCSGDQALLTEETREMALSMTDRKETIVRAFTHSSPTITAHQIYDCIYNILQLQGSDIRMIQIDGTMRYEYIIFHTSEFIYSVIQATKVCVKFGHNTVE
jgi:hypothetical protein